MRLVFLAWLTLITASGGCFRGTFGENSGKKPQRHLSPAKINGGGRTASGARLRIITLNVFADTEYVRRVPRWKPRFRNLLGRANKVVEPLLHLRFEVGSMKTWSRESPAGDRRLLLLELQSLDVGKQMTFVVGLVPSLPRVATSYEEMGAAVVHGRHLFVRSVDDLREHQALERGWDSLSAEERNKIYLERKHHRELVVFLHELGHLLGVDHHDDDTSIMYEGYRTAQKGFAPASAATMRGSLVEELAGGRDDLAERRKAEQRTAARDNARRALDAAHRSNNGDDAGLHLQEAEAILAPYGQTVADLWATIAEAYRDLNHVTLAEQALVRAGKYAPVDVRRWVVRTRARFAIPADAASLGLTPANESEYIATYNAIVAAIAEDDTRTAKKLARAAKKEHGDLPGFDVLMCDVAMRDRKFKRATALCARGLARCETASWAHFLAGHLALRKKDRTAASKHFARAVELDPELAPARRALAKLRDQ